MICNVCGKKEATIHLTEIVNNQAMEMHLCEECAKEKGTELKGPFSFKDLLTGLADFSQALNQTGAEELKCPSCGLTYKAFGKGGRLGCSGCYRAFAKLLLPLIKRVQGSTQHVGKRPEKLSPAVKSQVESRKLQEELQRAVQAEDFERAAQLRDEIKALAEKVKSPRKKDPKKK
ncbi:MAG: UvrB/UvrC motif-containing protein [Candidatus Omnitrophica bacterium]|nr:UvrB/UvrC motif-containing protein [Candidatus Omnitrophota bacterium]